MGAECDARAALRKMNCESLRSRCWNRNEGLVKGFTWFRAAERIPFHLELAMFPRFGLVRPSPNWIAGCSSAW
jgi:hypothetical protein